MDIIHVKEACTLKCNTMDIIAIEIALWVFVLTSGSLGLQFASYVNTSKNDLPTSKKCDR